MNPMAVPVLTGSRHTSWAAPPSDAAGAGAHATTVANTTVAPASHARRLMPLKRSVRGAVTTSTHNDGPARGRAGTTKPLPLLSPDVLPTSKDGRGRRYTPRDSRRRHALSSVAGTDLLRRLRGA